MILYPQGNILSRSEDESITEKEVRKPRVSKVRGEVADFTAATQRDNETVNRMQEPTSGRRRGALGRTGVRGVRL